VCLQYACQACQHPPAETRRGVYVIRGVPFCCCCCPRR
jgi:hypothetical protein